MTERRALVVGGTGLVGGHCLDLLLARPDVSRVVALVRRDPGKTHPKLDTRTVDFEALDTAAAAFEGVTEVYACLGTTIKMAGTRERFSRVDHDYTVEVAQRAHAAGARRLALVSSVGAAEGSGNFYLRVKGETERDVAALGWDRLALLRPSLLLGERHEARRGEALGSAVGRAFTFALVGKLRRFRPIQARAVAAAMIAALGEPAQGQEALEHDAIAALAGTILS